MAKEKKKKRRLFWKIFLPIIAVLFVGLELVLLLPTSFVSTKKNDQYEYTLNGVISEDSNPRVVDIAFLGAHDAFTDGISFTSKRDTTQSGILGNAAVHTLGKGVVVRLSKTQNASAKEMLYAGTRYFDVRISEIDGVYYTAHSAISDKLEVYVQDIVDYLDDHVGEIIIFDIQHFYTADGENYELSSEVYSDLLTYMSTITNESGKSILDYCYYDSTTDSLGSLTYNEVTQDRTTSAVIMMAKVEGIKEFYPRDGDASYEITEYTSVRSLWHETNSMGDLFSGIQMEYEYLVENYDSYSSVFRVNQAQRTGFLSSAKLINSLFEWDLLNMAQKTNAKIIENEERFKNWLTVMPIVMVDYVTSNKSNFNELANQYIKEYNETL